MTSEADAPREGLGEVYKDSVWETQQRGTVAETVPGQDAGLTHRDTSYCRLENVGQEPQHYSSTSCVTLLYSAGADRQHLSSVPSWEARRAMRGRLCGIQRWGHLRL